ncbi:hypothetical protein DL96DRAFT_872071 [Flagelloscypha sp. PMI_526]|nr:hypothetical protein DL96DRAFT_872071 [Flagelloscypha sp. PMI_526]
MAESRRELEMILPSPGIRSKAATTSISSLPSELLFELFLSAVSGPELSTDSERHPVANTCLVLAGVCQAWRRCALGFPMLWSFIRIQATTASTLIPMLTLWLNRSRDCVLDIHVLVSSSYAAKSAHLLEALILHSKRWQNIHMLLSDSFFFDLFSILDTEQIELPHLRSARLFKLPRVPSCFKNAPLLRHLDIRLQCPAQETFKSLSGGYQNLRTLSVERGSATESEVLDCLASHTQLSSFTAGMAPYEQGRPIKNIVLNVLNLVYLELRLSCRVLRALHCPHLHTLHLTTDGSTNSRQLMDGLEDLPAFISRSPSLKSLVLFPVDDLLWMSDPHLSGCSLERLHFTFLEHPDTLRLYKLGMSHVCLPYLTTISLSFRSAGCEESHLRTVEEFLPYLSRPGGRPRLNTFPALTTLNVRINLWSRSVKIEKAIVWMKKWRDLEKSVSPGSLVLTLLLPKDDQSGAEVVDITLWSERLKPEKVKHEGRLGPKKFGSGWTGLATRFR